MKTPYIAGLCLLSAVGGYYAGSSNLPTDTPTSAEDLAIEPIDASSEVVIEEALPQTAPPVADQPLPPKESLKAQISSLTLENAQTILDEIRAHSGRKEQRGLLIDYFRKLGEISPENAIKTTETFNGTDRMSFLTAAIAGWAKVDPDAAWDRFKFESKDGMLNAMNPWAVVSELAKRDLADAVLRVQDLKGRRSPRQGIYAILQVARDTGMYSETWQTLDYIEDPDLKESATSQLFRLWSDQAPDSALDYLGQLTDPEERTAAMAGFLRGWSQADTQAALDFVVANFDDPAVSDSAKNLGRSMMRSLTSDEFLDALNSIENPKAQQEVASGILRDLVALDPAITLSFVERIPDQNERRSETRNVVRQWLQFDPDSAANYVLSLEDEDLKTASMSAFLDPRAIAKDYAENSETGARYFDMLASLQQPNKRRTALFQYASASKRLRKNGKAEIADHMLLQITQTEQIDDVTKERILKFAGANSP